jgi:hypothetical protein
MAEPRTKDFNRTTFGRGDRVVLVALAEAMFSEDGDVAHEKLESFVWKVDSLVSNASRESRAGLRFMLWFIRWSPILLFFSLSTFDALGVEKRVAVLDRMDRSSIGLIALMLVAYRTLLTMAFYEDPEELKLLGYPGDERKTYLRLEAKRRTESAA